MCRRMRKILRVLIILGLATLLIAAPVWAAYSATIRVIESNNTNYTELPIRVAVDNTYLAANGFITATGLDTRVEAGGVAIPHMVADDKLLFVDSVSANITANFQYTTGNTALSSFPVIVGHDGYITVTDDASIELGDAFHIEMKVWVDTSASAVSDNVTTKADAFNITISAVGSIKAEIIGGTSVTATTVASGVHTIEVIADGVDLKIFIDTVEKGSSALGGVGVTDNGSNLIIGQNDVIRYIEYFKVTV